MAKEKAWWVCNKCKTKLVRVGKGVLAVIREHQKTCFPSGAQIKRVADVADR